MFDLLKGRLGPEAPHRLIEPTAIEGTRLALGTLELEIVEFGHGEAKHHACLLLADRHGIVASDLIYNGAHLYLQEHNLEGWLTRRGGTGAARGQSRFTHDPPGTRIRPRPVADRGHP